MSAEYSVGEVRKYAKTLRDKCNLTGWGVMADMLDDLAERIEADESAVPFAWVCETVNGYSAFSRDGSFTCNAGKVTPLFTHPPAPVAQTTTKGLVLAAAIYMGAVKGIFALRSDGPPYNERKVTRDDAALRAFDHLDAATKALRSAISHFAPTTEPVAQAGADGGVGIDCVSHSPDAADSERVEGEALQLRIAEVLFQEGCCQTETQITRLADRIAALAAQGQGDQNDGLQPSLPKPRMPIGSLGLEDFCFCNNEVSLQAIAGGGAPEGYLGSVRLKVGGEFVTYIREPASPVGVPDGNR